MNSTAYDLLVEKVNNDFILGECNLNTIETGIKNYGETDFLVGMKAYYFIRTNDLASAEKIIAPIQDKQLGTYSMMIKGVIADIKNENPEKYFKASKDLDSSNVNRWVDIELFYHKLKRGDNDYVAYLKRQIELHPDFIEKVVSKLLLK